MGFILFFRNIIKPKNWPLLIFVLLNIGMIAFLLVLFACTFDLSKFTWTMETWELPLYGIALYFIVWIIFLTPIGELIFRLLNRLKRIKRTQETEELYKKFDSVYEKAKEKSKLLSKKVKLYEYRSEDPNALALGRSTLAITDSIAYCLDDKEFEGVLAHEFGHLSSGDSLMSLSLLASNIVLLIIVTFLKWLILIPMYFISLIFYCLAKVYPEDRHYSLCALFSSLVSLLYTGWILIGKLMMLATSRLSEYKADNYAKNLDYGPDLANALIKIDPAFSLSSSMLQIITQSHPDTSKRIEKLLA